MKGEKKKLAGSFYQYKRIIAIQIPRRENHSTRLHDKGQIYLDDEEDIDQSIDAIVAQRQSA